MGNALFKPKVCLRRMLLTGIFVLSRILNLRKLMAFVMKAVLSNQKVNIVVIAYVHNIGNVAAFKSCCYKNESL